MRKDNTITKKEISITANVIAVLIGFLVIGAATAVLLLCDGVLY